jgi:4-amino-4-deoxy-L-arabinose transferase-like glycosyltransferase
MKLFSIKENKVTLVFLSIFFLIGLILRTYQLESFPVGFHIDEASKGYSAYSILKTGMDDNGNLFPLYIDIFGDNSPSGYHVLAVIPVAILGLTEFSVRLPGAISGALSIFAIYLLSYVVFKNKTLGIISAFLLTISPWHINLSRASNEGLISLFFIMVGFACVFWSIETKRKKYILIGTAILCISFLFYQTPRLFVPSMYLGSLLFFLTVYRNKLKTSFKKILILSFVALVIVDFILIFVIQGGSGRFSQVNIFTYPETQLVLDEQIREDGVIHTTNTVTRIFHNKLINFPLAYVSNYFSYFSLNFLFINNLPPWYSVPGMGVLYISLFPFILYGIFKSAWDKNHIQKILLIWVVLSPMAAATALDTNNIHRAIVLFPILEILGAYGMYCIYNLIPKGKNIFAVLISLLLFANMAYFLHQYFVHAKIHRPWYRNVGFKEMMEQVNNSYDSFDYFIVTKSTGGIYPLVQFYSNYDPSTYLKEGSPKDKPFDGFGKFFFVSHECPSLMKDEKYPKGKLLFINNGVCKNDIRYKEEVIYRPDNTPSFKIVDPNIKMREDADILDPEKDF